MPSGFFNSLLRQAVIVVLPADLRFNTPSFISATSVFDDEISSENPSGFCGTMHVSMVSPLCLNSSALGMLLKSYVENGSFMRVTSIFSSISFGIN